MDQRTPVQQIVTESATLTEFVTGDNTFQKNAAFSAGNVGDFYGFSTSAPTCPGSFTLHMTQRYNVSVGLNVFSLTTVNSLTYTSNGSGSYAITVTNTTP
jgi:hypothetical protein